MTWIPGPIYKSLPYVYILALSLISNKNAIERFGLVSKNS